MIDLRLKELAELVRDCRSVQRAYWEEPTKARLAAMRKIEGMVDALVAEVLGSHSDSALLQNHCKMQIEKCKLQIGADASDIDL